MKKAPHGAFSFVKINYSDFCHKPQYIVKLITNSHTFSYIL